MHGQRVRERLEVAKDDRRDRWLALHWNEVVEELIPLGISQLFFFDAEQVRFMAEAGESNGQLGTAIKSLLGLDLAERLIADAAVLEARLSERARATADDSGVQGLKEARGAKQAALQAKLAERAALENERLRAEHRLRQAEERFARSGGHHWQQRQARQEQLSELENQQRQLQAQLVHLAASELPLALVPHLLSKVEEQDALERQAAEVALVVKLLKGRDQEMLQSLREAAVPEATVRVLKRLQDADRARRMPQSRVASRLKLSESARSLLGQLRHEGLSRRIEEAARLVERLQAIRAEAETVRRSLEATPKEADLAETVGELKAASRQLAVLDDRASRLDDEIKSLRFQRDELDRRLLKLRRAFIEHGIRSEEAARMAKLAIRTQTTMRQFLRRATAQKIDRLSGLVTESLRFLLRKKTVIQRAEIDPDTFAITLYDQAGQVLPGQRLSEGEKQIFAISVLWGLAQGSPCPLPAIIDTPMARLDARHRSHLVTRYFPNASHQVIILSTDTEVDQDCYRLLQPYIARAYHLKYNEGEKVTVAEPCYFGPAEHVPVNERPG